MRIGFVTGEYPPMEGGVGAFTEQLAQALALETHEVHIITSKSARSPDTPRQIRSITEPIDLGYAQLHPRVGRWGWSCLSVIADIVDRFDIEVVNIQYQAAAYHMRIPAINFAPWRLRGLCRTVVTFHDLRVPYLFPKAGGLRPRVVRHLAREADGCIATNDTDYDVLRSWTDKELRRIPIGSNISVYEPNHIEIAEARSNLGLKEGELLLGYFGFLNKTKGADIIVEAMTRLDDRFHLVFIGGQTGASDLDNNQQFLRDLQDQIGRAGLKRRIHWTGFLSPVRVSTLLAAADLMVMPYRDGVSLRRGTLMAVLAHGRPLITTQPIAAIPELVHGENLWLVSRDDPAELAKALDELAGNQTLRERLGHSARSVAEPFSWDAIARQTSEFFLEVVNSRRDKKSN